MRFSFWLRKWKRTASMARRRTQTSVRQRAGFRPRLEALEDRLVPSGGGPHHGGGGSGGGTFNSTAGSVKQLIADINYANTHGGTYTINLKSSTTFDLTNVNNTTNGYNGLPVIGGNKAVDLTILGNGDTIERDAGPNISSFRLFDVAQGASLTLDHVTLQNGDTKDGGAIYNQGTLKVSNSTLSGNLAIEGGGIYNVGGTAAISNTILSSNTADVGGGIENVGGTVTVSNNSILSGNLAYYVPPGYGVSASGEGGGIANSGGTVTVSNSTLSDNSAYYGGAIFNSGGTVAVSTSSTLSGNFANYGGGIYNYAGTLTLSSSTLSGNSAYYGGAIYMNGGTVSVSTCKLTGNSAKTYSTTEDFGSVTNIYGGIGGGIYVGGGTLTVNNSVFSDNTPDNIYGTYTDGGGNTGL